MTLNVVDKSAYGSSGMQACIGVETGQISDVVLMCGDPFRVQLIADQLENALEIAHRREYRTVNGYYKGRLVTAASHGVGCPSTAIAVEELARAGAKMFIRLGSTAALQPHLAVGDLVVSEGAVRNEGTSRAFVPSGYPAVPDLELTSTLRHVARQMGAEQGFVVHSGINVTDDAYYGETPEWISRYSSFGITNVEMESSVIFVIARQHNLRAAMVCSVSANLVTGDAVVEVGNDRVAVGWRQSITVALETVHQLTA
jgi:uridine phosphorylase